MTKTKQPAPAREPAIPNPNNSPTNSHNTVDAVQFTALCAVDDVPRPQDWHCDLGLVDVDPAGGDR